MQTTHTTFHTKLKKNIHEFIMFVYDVTEAFPKSELYGTTNQLRRAGVSVMLNNVEGYARRKPKVQLNMYETSYGSAKESKYLIFLAHERKWISTPDYKKGFTLIEEICKMLWSTINGLEKNISNID